MIIGLLLIRIYRTLNTELSVEPAALKITHFYVDINYVLQEFK